MNEAIGSYKDCIETFTGRMVSLSRPNDDDINIIDIAHSLGRQCRFAGHCLRFYSVAEHSVLVHDLLVDDHMQGPCAFAGLMHDAHEAYSQDVTRPAKQQLEGYAAFESVLAQAVRRRFKVQWADKFVRCIKQMDDIACRAEALQNMHSHGKLWNWGDVPLRRDVRLRCLDPEAATHLFLSRFRGYDD